MIQTQEKGSFMYRSWAHNTKVASTLVNRKIKFCSSVHKNATIFQLLFASMHAWYNFESYAKVTYGPTSYSSDLIGGVYTLYNMNTLEAETPTTLEYTNEKLVQLRNLSPVKLKCSAYMPYHNAPPIKW